MPGPGTMFVTCTENELSRSICPTRRRVHLRRGLPDKADLLLHHSRKFFNGVGHLHTVRPHVHMHGPICLPERKLREDCAWFAVLWDEATSVQTLRIQ